MIMDKVYKVVLKFDHLNDDLKYYLAFVNDDSYSDPFLDRYLWRPSDVGHTLTQDQLDMFYGNIERIRDMYYLDDFDDWENWSLQADAASFEIAVMECTPRQVKTNHSSNVTNDNAQSRTAHDLMEILKDYHSLDSRDKTQIYRDLLESKLDFSKE